jgi:hypothetical protein
MRLCMLRIVVDAVQFKSIVHGQRAKFFVFCHSPGAEPRNLTYVTSRNPLELPPTSDNPYTQLLSYSSDHRTSLDYT